MNSCFEELSLSSKLAAAKIQTFRQNDKFCDVSLYSGDTVVKAHRIVLASACPYFEAMFMESSYDGTETLVNLPDIPQEVLPLVVDFLYTGHVAIDQSTVQQLMSSAHILQIRNLITSCARYLESELNLFNSLTILRLAEVYSCSDLFSHTLGYIAKHWTVYSRTEEFLDLSLTVLINVLSSDELVVEGKFDVVLAVVRWLEHDSAARAQHCVQLMGLPPLRSLTQQELAIVWNNVKDGQLANLLRNFSARMVATSARLRSSRAFYIVGGKEKTSVFKYDLHNKLWEVLTPMTTACMHAGVATLGGKLYVAGGLVNNVMQNACSVYDPVTNVWSPIAGMSRGRADFCLAALDGRLYAFGFNTVDVYDPVADCWTLAGNMFLERDAGAVVTYEGAAYLIGGKPYATSRRLLRYEPAAGATRGEWSFRADMGGVRYDHSAAVLGGRLYVVGGRDENDTALNTVARYDFAMDCWEDMAPMEKARYSCALGVISAEGVLLVVGGLQDTKSYYMEMYIESEDRWVQGPAIPQRFTNVRSAMS